MRNERDISKSAASPDSSTQATPNPPTEHVHWQVGRLITAIIVCALIIGAALAYDTFG